MARPLLALGALAQMATAAAPLRVAVTGAGGQTSGHAFRKMLARPEQFSPLGIVRTEASKEALLEASGAKPEQVVVCDVSSAAAQAALAAALAGCCALLIGTSAKVKPTGGVNAETGRPNLGFPDGQPYHVDWLGQKHQIDAAKEAGVAHVVICSSMGGTDPAHPLNKFGKREDGAGGNILQWKRKAEKHLMDSGLTYTVLHPGGLLNEAGGRRELRAGVDDSLLTSGFSRSIPREDVAEVMLQSLLHEDYKNRSVDLVAGEEQPEAVATDFPALVAGLGDCDYSLGAIPDAAAEAREQAALASAL